MRVLIADSNQLFSEVYQQYLRKYGFQVFTANDALTCIAKLRGIHPDTLVLDPNLPCGGRREILDLIYAEVEVPPIVIALLPTPSPELFQKVSEYPVHEVRFKPLLPEELCHCIYRHDHSHGVLEQRDWIEEIEFEAETALVS